MTSSPQTLNVFFDEAGYYFGGQNDGLKEDLRKIEGVPNATYLVNGGQVFVFDKLVQLVDAKRVRNSDQSLADLARGLVAEATVSAKEAVETWGVVPEPYEIVESPSSGFMIRHRPFNALLPGAFQSKEDVQRIFAHLLLGGVQSGNGDFTYRDQPMVLCEPLDTARLPSRPVVQPAGEPESSGYTYTALGNVAYKSGFEPVSEALFDDVKEREAAWKQDVTRAARYKQDHVADLWAKAKTLRLETLNDPTDEVPEYEQEDFADLRPFYPELFMLSDGSLYAWFDAYHVECRYINGWEANRDDGFLVYLLGKVAGRQYEQDTALAVGQWVAYALLRGDSLDAAIAFGREAVLYDKALSVLARRIADALRFLAEDRGETERRGPPVRTMRDMFRQGRKYNSPSVSAEQSAVDLDREFNKSMLERLVLAAGVDMSCAAENGEAAVVTSLQSKIG